MELLLRHGANPLLTNSKGKSPLDVCPNDEICKLMRSEIIASTSSSGDDSRTGDLRSPTSPESCISDKDDMLKPLEKDLSEFTNKTFSRCRSHYLFFIIENVMVFPIF